MRFRWKLMILLLLIAIVPITAMRMLGTRGVRMLGDELVARSRKNLNVTTKNRLKFVVDSYSQMLSQKRETLEIALVYQAAEIERLLAQNMTEPASAYFAEDIDSGRDLPPDLDSASDYFRVISEHEMELFKITYSAQVFNFAPGVKASAVKDDIDRLSHLTPVYLGLSQYLKDLVIWQYTALENGLYTAYPGHGGFAENYDPRKQIWYSAAADPNSDWTDQFVDALTGRRVISVSRPVMGPAGQVRGVTAIIISIRNLLGRRLLSQHIPNQTRAFVAYPATQPGTDDMGIRVIARESTTDIKQRSWHTPFKADWLVADDDSQYQAMLHDFENGRGNIRRIHYKNCDCLWVYGPIHQNSFLMLITPYTEILEPALQAEAYIQSQIQKLIAFTNYAIGGILVVIIALALVFSRSVTRPLQILADGAKRLANGQLETTVKIRSRDEFGDMAQVFNSVGPRLEENYQLRKSLDLAMEVQQNLLPKFDPQIDGLEIAGKSDYCEETGGDYYDYLAIGHDRVRVVVGDVSGHGISSALLMTTARALLRQRTSQPGSIREIVADVNRQLTEDTEDSGQFMTLFYGEINLTEKMLHWVRAGHDAALFYDIQSDSFEELVGGGLPLGVTENTAYDQLQRDLRPGQIIVIGTDGIWETHNVQGAMFGKKNLQNIIRAHADRTPRDIVDAVTAALDDFRYPLKTRADDITLVVVKIKALGA
ncbi:Serine phosphatase RsbU, regulator of sigma subunit [Olavius sp. associated proteobacterium Delta 1]|nr:Serine phosphatase RsbU, regulator of sigma subunit [Olavius sp. associated proteobacterium Delta 1]